MSNAPPVPRKITAHDRKVLRDRLTGLFKERKLSGRRVERLIGAATGTLSKVLSGKMALTHRLLLELATLLKVTAESIVQDTAFDSLLTMAVVTPETEQVTRLKAELDAVRVEKQAVDAALTQAHEDLTSVRKQLAEAVTANGKVKERNSALAAELAAARSELDRVREEANQAQQKQRSALVVATNEREQRAAALAKIAALVQQAEQWRTYASDREQRVNQLEAYIQQLQAQANAGNGPAVGAALGTGLLGLVLGVVLSGDR